MRTTRKIHVSLIRWGDTIHHRGHDRTVGKKDIKKCPFMGSSVFGDTYNSGHKLVTLVEFNSPKNNK
jgi:hypothetical protein